MKKPTAIALITALVISQMPVQRARANAAVIIPEAAVILILGGIAYYVWINSQGYEEQVPVSPMLEDPEEEGEWGVYRAKDEDTCRWIAAGRPYEWLGNRQCKIKG